MIQKSIPSIIFPDPALDGKTHLRGNDLIRMLYVTHLLDITNHGL